MLRAYWGVEGTERKNIKSAHFSFKYRQMYSYTFSIFNLHRDPMKCYFPNLQGEDKRHYFV